eukprot:CAMPEP_0198308056 /NCGR_PEP_ID=MMETSP1450-20131203/840_1 /TAXON_ID=753684 ORGANISM="Madagascaria erythrocladiodes, Strain CCMP3234" /NCGR_SAMPLE_ID=MMETSP1450 /ASSEMBLY_ACC=CAM_ASM_001115 /LENGTH=203 /DNA_ID=CAMNT_0044010689 /DNA_START=127 /DNA_END=738 /DNA_ORIENTATION=-
MKVTYFKARARAEPTRMALALGGIPFEDERLGREEWMAFKPKTPYGSMPLLEDEGRVLAQSSAIQRYAAKKAGLEPSDPWLAAKVDEICAYLDSDVSGPLSATFAMSGEEKMAARKKIAEETWPPMFKKLDDMLAKNGTGYFVGESITMADLIMYNQVWGTKAGFMDGIPTSIMDDFSNIQKLYKNIGANPKIVEYQSKTYGE